MNPGALKMQRVAAWWAAASLSLSIHCVQTPAASPSDVPPATPPAPLDVLAAQAVASSVASHAAPPLPGSDPNLPLPIAEDNPTWGSPTAPVTLVEFGDLECPYTAQASPTVTQLETDYGPEKLRVVWKHNPLTTIHPHARAASDAAQGVMALAGSEGFWRFEEMALKGQRALRRGDGYVQWASQAGVPDIATYATGIANHIWALSVDRDLDLAKSDNVNAAPVFFVNGIRLDGAWSLQAFKDVVDSELAATSALTAAGVSPERIYAIRVKANFGQVHGGRRSATQASMAGPAKTML